MATLFERLGGTNTVQNLATASSRASCSPIKCGGSCGPNPANNKERSLVQCRGRSSSNNTNNSGSKCSKDKGKILSVLLTIREPIAEYQQKGGLGRYEQVGFLCLLTSIYQQAFQACLAFMTMLCNLLPFVDVFLLVVRFSLDKMICIVKSDNMSSIVVGVCALVAEIFIILLFLWLIGMFLLVPIITLVLGFVYRILGMN